ncbi:MULTISPECIES: VOC family protein [Methylococcus]|uniref:VOC family protein n=1 Tax=Methylococcus capsulatus TaxID=414 RepID=A0ABZ2F347_METCP|nr:MULTISPECIES: VOC family protein [Methylococcus]MDF9392235.1 VOC family protein [Methylococcus capsulatus]
MRIALNSLFLDEQHKVLRFHTDVLGLVNKQSIPLKELRGLTVVSPEGPDDLELVLEQNAKRRPEGNRRHFPNRGIPVTAFAVDDTNQEYERLASCGVKFTTEPTGLDSVTIAIVAGTGGNLVQICQG